MSETLFMAEIEQLLEEVSRVACSFHEYCCCDKCLQMRSQLEELKKWTTETLICNYGLNRDDAENEVAAAVGEM